MTQDTQGKMCFSDSLVRPMLIYTVSITQNAILLESLFVGTIRVIRQQNQNFLPGKIVFVSNIVN